MDLGYLANNLEFQDGIWFSKSTSQVSCPPNDLEPYFQDEEKSFWLKHRKNCIVEMIKNFPTGGYLADVGGGSGYLGFELEKNGVPTLLVEPRREKIFNAQRRGLKNLLCSTLADAGFYRGALKSIGIFDVLEHQQDDVSFLLMINDILAIEGRLFLTVPSFNILWSQGDDFMGHHHRYTLESLTNKLDLTGFTVEYSTYIFSILPVLIFLFRKIPTLLRVRKDYNEDSLRKDYIKNYPFLGGLLEKIWQQELTFITQKKRIKFGSSCLVVARKTF